MRHKPLLETRGYHTASIRSAQYLSGLTIQQNLWEETGKVLVNFFGADLGAIGERRKDGEIVSHHWTFSEEFSGNNELETVTAELIAEVLESGYLALRSTLDLHPISLACLPIAQENQIVAVMIAGHKSADPCPEGLLSAYLTVAGLVGATAARLTSEREVRRHHLHLEQLVEKRTAELTKANENLQIEIIQRKQAEEELAHSHEDLRVIIDSVHDAIFIHELDGRIIDVNNKALEMFAVEPEEALTYSIEDDYLSPENPTELLPGIWNDVIAGVPRIFEWKAQRPKDGFTFDVEVFHRKISLQDKNVILATVRDISERKRAELKLKQAKDLAEEANRLKSEFLANMSHEIRTPMNGVLGMAELLLDTELTEEQGEYARAVKASTEALMAIINDILDFSKIETRQMDIESVPFSLRENIGDSLQPLAVQATEKGLELTCNIPPKVPDAVIGDPGHLRQIIFNVVENAIKFTETGKVVVSMAPGEEDEGQALFHFTVTDTGIGIPEDKQQEIFTAFAQADASTTRRYGGAGLGLTISTRLVKLMGGRLWVESEIDKGSTFHFTMRLSLQKDFPVRQPPSIALKTQTIKEDRETCLQAGMDNHIIKPLNTEAHLAAIENLVASQSGTVKVKTGRDRSNGTVFNQEHLLASVDGDRELLRELVELFLADYPKALTEIQDALAKGDAHRLNRAAHGLKGSVSNFDAPTTVDLAFRLEKMGKDLELGGAKEVYVALTEEMESLRKALEVFAASNNSGDVS